jgi:hypothetical protein
MKLIYTFSLLFIVQLILAQTPKGFKYQAVVRDNLGNVLVNKIVSIKSSILEGSISGSSIYEEKQTLATNDYGVVNLTIGQGTNISGNFNTISWGNNLYFLKTELDVTGGNNFQFMGTSQLMSVPYALYADKSGASKNDLDTSATNEIQTLNLNGRNLSISGGNNIQLPDDNDGDNTNEIQTLSINDHTISISNSNSVVIPDNQVLSLNSNNLTISNGNTIVLPPDSDANPTNEIQALSLINDTLYLSNGGFVNMLPFKDNTDNQQLSITGNQLQISGGNSVTITGAVDLDADPTNELQLLSKSGDTLYLSQGNYVIIPPDADHDPTNELQTITVTGDSIKISNGGGAIKIPTPTNAIVPSGTCIYSNSITPPFGYSYSGETTLSSSINNWSDIIDSINTNYVIDYYEITDSCLFFLYRNTSNTNYLFGKHNFITNKFHSLSNAFTQRSGYTSQMSFGGNNGKLYLYGGGSNSSDYTIVDEYDITTDTWIRLSDASSSSYSGNTTILSNNHFIFFCNASNGTNKDKITVFNKMSNTWNSFNITFAGTSSNYKLFGDSVIFQYYQGAVKIVAFDANTNQFFDLNFSLASDSWCLEDNYVYSISGTGTPAIIEVVKFDLITKKKTNVFSSSSSLNNTPRSTANNNALYLIDDPFFKIDLRNPNLNSLPSPNYNQGSSYKLKTKISNNYLVVFSRRNTFNFYEIDVLPLPKVKYMHCAD